jgi:transcriptional regulator with XRE-family HTH domain
MTTRDSDELQEAVKNIGQEIKTLRIDRELSQSEVARTIGARQPLISRIEKGTHVPTWRNLEKIARALKAKVEVHIVPDEDN